MQKKLNVPNAERNLHLDFCTFQAAKYAVENWHYSKSMPYGKSVRIGVWENNKFIGVVIFSRGASRNIGRPFGLKQTEICELTRIALRTHEAAVTKIVSIALNLLKKANKGIKLVVSFSDPNYGHLGKIYQAGNWVFMGRAGQANLIKLRGVVYQTRTIGKRYNTHSLDWIRKNIDSEVEKVIIKRKYKYLMPLEPSLKELVEKFRKPYLKEIN